MTESHQRWKCVCAYDGTDWEGWQSQVGGRTIQDRLEKAIAPLFRDPPRIVGSGRTDSGVHARGQVFHFDGSWRHGGDAFLLATNSRLPTSIRINSIEPVDANFHARYSATGKRYRYRCCRGDASPFQARFIHSLGKRPVDSAAMAAAAACFEGTHDFRGFAARREAQEDTVRTIHSARILTHGARVDFEVEGEGFLYKQVRSMMGALLEVGAGKLDPEQLRDILLRGERTERVPTAAPGGLTLERVWYQ